MRLPAQRDHKKLKSLSVCSTFAMFASLPAPHGHDRYFYLPVLKAHLDLNNSLHVCIQCASVQHHQSGLRLPACWPSTWPPDSTCLCWASPRLSHTLMMVTPCSSMDPSLCRPCSTAALHCIVLHRIASHCIALRCTALHCSALHCIGSTATLHWLSHTDTTDTKQKAPHTGKATT